MKMVANIGQLEAHEQELKQTELAKTLERLEAITKPADSALFSALVHFDEEQSWLLD